MKVKIMELHLNNFKGQTFSFKPDKKNQTIYGDNGAGKTTLYDAFAWLLTDKDSQGKADFEIKSIESNGEASHGVEHSVSAVLFLDNNKLSLQKTYKEKWVKKKGSLNSIFTGNTTLYSVNDLPVSKKDYLEEISSIAAPATINNLINPENFNKQNWRDRRNIIFELTGDTFDINEFAANNPELAELISRMGDIDIDIYKKRIKGKQKKINEQLKEIPARIDERTLSIKDIVLIDKEISLKKMELLAQDKKAFAEKKAFVLAGGGLIDKKTELADTQMRMLEEENKLNKFQQEKVKPLLNSKIVKESEIKAHKQTIERYEIQHKSNMTTISRQEKILIKLKVDYRNENERKFVAEQTESICPACGQDLPPEQIKEALINMAQDFNRLKANALKEINVDGLSKKKYKEAVEIENIDILEKIKAEKEDIEIKTAQVKQHEKSLQELQDKPDSKDSETYKNLVKQEKTCIQDIENIENGKDADTAPLDHQLNAIQEEINACVADIQRGENVAETKTRIKELENERDKLSAEYEKIAKEIFLIDQFTMLKAENIEADINDLFEITTWKMFETQVDGGINDTCVAMHNGIPYDLNLNTGHKIMVGLDIINTLSKFYNVSLPVFVDSAESVTKLPKLDEKIQVIKLVKPDISKYNKEYYGGLKTEKFNVVGRLSIEELVNAYKSNNSTEFEEILRKD